MPDAVKAYQCRHLFADGHRCGSKSLRNEHFCFYHHATRKPTPKAPPPANPAEAAFDLPYPEDRSSIQLAIGDILRRIALNQIDSRRAGLLLYGLQIASCNLPKAKADREPPEETVDEIEFHPELGPVAPEAQFIPYKEEPSFLHRLLEEFGPEDEANHPPSARTTNLIPALQACATHQGAPGRTVLSSDLGLLPISPLHTPNNPPHRPQPATFFPIDRTPVTCSNGPLGTTVKRTTVKLPLLCSRGCRLCMCCTSLLWCFNLPRPSLFRPT